ncbi:MAG: YARHG domain-containing protein [Polyangiaceae bacterium]|nr:YARHG domain-containing protein [Polyangiaceae bacterium]
MNARAFAVLAAVSITACSEPAEKTASSGPPATSSPASAPKPSATTAASTPAPSASVATPAAPARPLYYDRALTEEDLQGRTLRELSLLRNTIFARAGNTFRRPWLDKHFRAQDWYQPKEAIDTSKITQIDKDNARKISEHDAAIPREELTKMKDEILARKNAGKATPEDAVELSLLSQRLGELVGTESEGEASPLEDPTRLDKILKVEDLSTLSRRDLRILRNTVYARRGRKFDSKVVQGYFATATWYKPDLGYDDSRLNETDRKNIAVIRSVETSLGGPLHENPDFDGRDQWFSGA